MPKPTIVLIPGAWHTPTPYLPFLRRLEALGFPTASGKLPSVISPDPSDESRPADSHTLASDVAFAREHIVLPALETNDVVLLLHSYGGVVGGAAAHGLGPADRKAEGKKHAVLGLVYLCAIVGFEGRSMITHRDELQPWTAPDDACTRITVPDPVSVFYEQLPSDSEERAVALAALRHHSYTVFSTPSPAQAYAEPAFEGRCVYVRCHQDKAIALALQDIFHGASSGLVKWALEDIEGAGHSPFMTHRDETTAIVVKWADKWAEGRE